MQVGVTLAVIDESLRDCDARNVISAIVRGASDFSRSARQRSATLRAARSITLADASARSPELENQPRGRGWEGEESDKEKERGGRRVIRARIRDATRKSTMSDKAPAPPLADNPRIIMPGPSVTERNGSVICVTTRN